jgi:hypothetical protein
MEPDNYCAREVTQVPLASLPGRGVSAHGVCALPVCPQPPFVHSGLPRPNRFQRGVRTRFEAPRSSCQSREKAEDRAGRIAASLLSPDLVILDELGYLPFSQACGALLFHPLSRLYEHERCHYHYNQPRLRRMVQRVRRREDDDGVARPAHASLPHRGGRQRELPFPPQQRQCEQADPLT